MDDGLPQQSLFSADENNFKNKKSGRPKRKHLKDILPSEEVRLTDIIENCRIVEGVHDVAGIMFDELYASLFSGKKPLYMTKFHILCAVKFGFSSESLRFTKHFSNKSYCQNTLVTASTK